MFVRPIQSPPGNPSPSGFLRLPGRKTPTQKLVHTNPALLPFPPSHMINRAWKMRVTIIIPVTHPIGIYGGFLLGVRSVSGLAFYDWDTLYLVRRIEIQPKHVMWS